MSVEAVGRRLQRLAVRTGAGPLRPLWAVAHAGVIWAVALRLSFAIRGSRVFLKGGFGFGRPVYGLSDVDMVIVVPGTAGGTAAVARVQERWARLTHRLPTLAALFNDGDVWVYDAADLAAVRRDGYLTFGRHPPGEGGAGRAALLGRGRPGDPMALLDHPGLYGPQRDWRALGTRRRPPAPAGDAADRALRAWLELRFIWGFAFLVCADPARESAAYICRKLVADGARVWLWLGFGERLDDRAQVLERALSRMPDEHETLARAARRGGHRQRRPAPSLAQTLEFLLRTSAKVAEHLNTMAGAVAGTPVQLRWNGPDELVLDDALPDRAAWLPLADWRARAIPGRLDVAFSVRPGHPGDPAQVTDALRASRGSRFPALRGGPTLVFPTEEIWHRGRLRGIECETTDPVSLALARGSDLAAFPGLPGWSAEDSARRALAEHRAWLALGPLAEGNGLPHWTDPLPDPRQAELSGLFSASRAALFADSLAQGRPELPLTLATISAALADARPTGRPAVEAAYAEMRGPRAPDRKVDRATVTALRGLVCELPAYRCVRHLAAP